MPSYFVVKLSPLNPASHHIILPTLRFQSLGKSLLLSFGLGFLQLGGRKPGKVKETRTCNGGEMEEGDKKEEVKRNRKE